MRTLDLYDLLCASSLSLSLADERELRYSFRGFDLVQRRFGSLVEPGSLTCCSSLLDNEIAQKDPLHTFLYST